MTDPTPIEDRLRQALAARAEAVEPQAGGADASALTERADAARRHAGRQRIVLSAAAVVAVVALAAGAFVLWPDSDDETDIATGPGESTTTTAASTTGTVDADEVIWPLPSMSLVYETPAEAAAAFMTGFLGLDGECLDTLDVHTGPTDVRCPASNGGPSTTVATAPVAADRWAVTGATSSAFTAELYVTTAGASSGSVTVPSPESPAALVTATGDDLAPPVIAEIRPLGILMPSATATSDLAGFPIPAGDEVQLQLDRVMINGPHVLVVIAADTASVFIFDLDNVTTQPAPTTTTTTTVPGTDDGVRGWPGPVGRVFDDPESAAQAFVDEVLGLPDPALADATGDDTDMIFEYAPRPTATVTTAITVHNTGNVRGWVVTGLQGTSGTIDSASLDGTTVTITGSALAFEAHVAILVLDEQGNILGESFTMAGGTEVLPYEGTVEVDLGLGTPFWVMIAEGDASGEGDFTWATTANL